MSHVIGINGSPRKNKNSATMLEHALRGAKEAGATTERFDLVGMNFSGCRSCFACKLLGGKSFGRCALRDDLTDVLRKILAADALIIATPIYFGDVPGMVRNLYERIWFPSLMYKKDGSVAYDRRVKVGLIYTMGMPNLSQVGNMIKTDVETFQHFLGHTEYVTTHETLQFDDYSRYVGDHKLALKQKIHEEQFPVDCQQAYEMGRRLAE